MERINSATSKENLEARAAVEELTLQRMAFAFIEQNLKFAEQEPLSVIEDLVAALPDAPRVLTQDGLKLFLNEVVLENGRRSVLDHGDVTPLESYLVYLLMRKSPRSTQLDSVDDTTPESFSIADSIRILRDQVRTKRFLQGIAQEVKRVRESKDASETIRVCDAGCGAVPILGLYAAMQDKNVAVVCIEKNPAAAKIAEKYIDLLGLTERISVLCGDARTITPAAEIDILVSETMDVALFNEPMADILAHLKTFVAENGAILPQEVKLYASIIPMAEYSNASSYSLVDVDAAPVLSTNWQAIGGYKGGDSRPSIEITLQSDITSDEAIVVLTSEVMVANNVPVLSMNTSRLTQPMPLPEHGGKNIRLFTTVSGSQLRLSYTAGDHPTDVHVSS